jgi:DNA polymerase III delta subunit
MSPETITLKAQKVANQIHKNMVVYLITGEYFFAREDHIDYLIDSGELDPGDIFSIVTPQSHLTIIH